jgi:hypothetical protein
MVLFQRVHTSVCASPIVEHAEFEEVRNDVATGFVCDFANPSPHPRIVAWVFNIVTIHYLIETWPPTCAIRRPILA